MKRGKSKFAGLAFLALVILAVGAGAMYHLLVRSLPATTTELNANGIAGDVEIFRDGAGVPHIMAGSEDDMYFAAGFVHAQDRLWQMDLFRRLGRGRLSEILGSKALTADRLMRTLSIGRTADTLLVKVSAETRRILAAYTRGVNHCISNGRGKYPLEFDLLQYDPEPWSMQDCLIIERLLGWELTLSWWIDLTLGDLAQALGEEKAREVIPLTDPHCPAILPVIEGRIGAADSFRDAVAELRTLTDRRGSAIGSNCWAVSGEKSATGLPLLANDTHLPHMQPGQWYIMHMQCPTMNAAGVSIPGAPGIVIGHNDHLAWGMTNAMADNADFVMERVSFRDSTWEYQGSVRRLGVRVDSILVRDSAAVEHIVYSTAHGPLVNGAHPARPAAATTAHEIPIAIRWTGFDESDEILAVARMNRAQSWPEFKEALRTYGLPAQNITCVGKSGFIGYILAGRIPLRPAAAAVFPSEGWTPAAEWRGYVPFEQMPYSFSEPGSRLAHANNPVSHELRFYLSGIWESDARIKRILELLDEPRAFDTRDFRLMQLDEVSHSAPMVRDAFVRALQRMPDRSLELTRVMNLLAQWDSRMTENSVAASIFNAAFTHLLRAALEDEMGADRYKRYVQISNVPVRAMERLLADTATTWFDDVRTPQIETKEDILRKAVLLGMLDLTRRRGTSMQDWKWGAVHTLTFRHPLGETAPLEALLNVGPLPAAGNNSTLNNGDYLYAEPYECVVGAAMRLIVDVSSMDTCEIVLPTGQSGQPLSPHYSDQTVLWQNGAYHQLVSDAEAIRKSGWERLLLKRIP